jgi:4-amino-4-deoxy-L-arabinose transferase-like glycosyltransferase
MSAAITRPRQIDSNQLFRVGLILIAGILFFARLGDRALWSMEVRWGEIPREMVQSGDYLTPTINGHLYYDKPLGSYWLVLLASFVTGGVNEWAARLPSAAAGLLAVLLVVRIGRRLFDERTGLVAGLILATSFSFTGFARTASADMENVAGVLAAITLFLEGGERPQAWRIIALWLVMAFTSLTKGLLGFALPILVIGVDCMIVGMSQRRRWLLHWATPIGICLAGLAYFAPFLLASDRTIAGSGLGMVFRENLQRFFAPHNHKGPIYLYAYVIFGLLAPWSAFLPAAIIEGFQRPADEASRNGRRFAQVFFWATFLFFSLSASRRSYYLLPLLPAAAIMIARLLSMRSGELSRASRIALKAGYGIIAIGVVAAVVAVLPARWVLPGEWAELPRAPVLPVFVAIWLACCVGIGLAYRHFNARSIVRSVGVVATLWLAYLNLIAIPSVEEFRGQREFAEFVRQSVGDDESQLALFRTREIVYYLHPSHHVAEFATDVEMAEAVRRGDVRFAIVHERDLDKLGLPCETVAREPSQSWNTEAAGSRSILVAFRDANGNRQESR